MPPADPEMPGESRAGGRAHFDDDADSPTYEEARCMPCCDGTVFQPVINFIFNGPYFNVADVEDDLAKRGSTSHVPSTQDKMLGTKNAAVNMGSSVATVNFDPIYSQSLGQSGEGLISAAYPGIAAVGASSTYPEIPGGVPPTAPSAPPIPSMPPLPPGTVQRMSASSTSAGPEVKIEARLTRLRARNSASAGDLLPLPFEPPRFYTYILELLLGTGIVAQYVVTMLLALMVAQAELEKYQDATSGMPQLIKTILIFYPLLTLSLLLLANAEIIARKFMYYRLMSLGVIMDFQDQPIWKAWFFWYFVSSWIVLNVWTLYAMAVTREERASPTLTTWVIVNLQSFLMLNFHRVRCLATEELLITVNNFIERAPSSAKAIIEHCDILREGDVAREMVKVMRQLHSPLADCSSVVFDLARLRATKNVSLGFRRRRTSDHQGSQQQAGSGGGEEQGSLLWRLLERNIVRHLYASSFIFLLFTKKLLRSRHAIWPYQGDLAYFVALWFTACVCLCGVLGVEAYGLWLAFGRSTSVAAMYGSSSCFQCYDRLYSSALGCSQGGMCLQAPASTAFCLGQDMLSSYYALNSSALAAVGMQCPHLAGVARNDFLPGVPMP